MSSIKQRAVNSEQKQERISQILDAAANRFSHQDYIDIRLMDIASDVGITKAALYRYFRTKETLFLALYEQQLSLLGERAKHALASEALVPALTRAILSVPLYSKLTAILHTILERNLTVEEAVSFKQLMIMRMSGLVDSLAPHLDLPRDAVVQRLLMLHQCIIGAWANCHPSDVVQEAFDKYQELTVFDLSYQAMLNLHISSLFSIET